MSEVVVVGSFTADPGKEADLQQAFEELVAPTHADLESDHIKAILTRADELWGDNGDITVFAAIPAGEEKQGSLAAHAG